MYRHPTPHIYLPVLLAVVGLLAAAAPASGHAVLLRSEPASEQLLAEAPDHVRLHFSERVSLALGGVDVFAPSARLVARGPAAAAGEMVTAPVRVAAQGTYAVSWRVVSADGHPVRGAFVFSVGRRSSASAAQEQAFAAAATDRPLAIAFGVVRFGYLAGILIAAGGALFAVAVAPRWMPRFVAPALIVVIVASLIGFVLQAAIAADIGIDDALDPDILDAQLSTLYGNAVVVRVLLAALGLVALRLAAPFGQLDVPARVLTAMVFVALPASQSIAGHAMARPPIGLRVPLDMAHVAFAAAWVGGLVQLQRYTAVAGLEPPVVVRYSRLALVSVIALVATGSFAALAEADISLDALVTSGYGRILIAKLVLFGLTLPLANLNRSRNVPAIVAGGPDAPGRLRRFVQYELLVLAAILALTAWLIDTTPARHAAHRPGATPGPVVETRTLPSGARVTVTIEPGAAGPNTIDVRVRRRSGEPDNSIDQLSVTGSLPGRRVDRLPLKVKRTARGRWSAAGQVVPLAGRWRFDVALRRGEFDEERTHIDAEIR